MVSRRCRSILLRVCRGMVVIGLGLGWAQAAWGADAPAWHRDYKARKEAQRTTGADKVSASLRSVVTEIETHGVAAVSNPLVRIDQEGRLHSYMYVRRWGAPEAAQLKRHAVIVERSQVEAGIVQAWIPFDRMMQVAQLDFVKRITPPVYASLHPRQGRPDGPGQPRPDGDKIAVTLQTVLQALQDNVVQPEQRAKTQLETFSTPLVRVNERGAIHAYLHVTELNASRLAALEAKGFELEIANAVLKIIQGWIPYDRVEDIASEAFIKRIEAPRYGALQAKPIKP